MIAEKSLLSSNCVQTNRDTYIISPDGGTAFFSHKVVNVDARFGIFPLLLPPLLLPPFVKSTVNAMAYTSTPTLISDFENSPKPPAYSVSPTGKLYPILPNGTRRYDVHTK